MNKVSLFAGGVGSLFLMGVTSMAGASLIIVDPVSAIDNGHYPYGSSAPASRTIDGSGLSDTTVVETGDVAPPPGGYPTVTDSASNFYDNYAVMPGTANPTITYTLGGSYTIVGGHFWQYSGDIADTQSPERPRDLISADIYTSPDGVTYTLAGTLVPGYGEGPYGTIDAGVDFSLAAPVANVQYIELRNITGPTNPNGYIQVAFNEIRFTANALPEPTSIGLLGVAGALFMRRRGR